MPKPKPKKADTDKIAYFRKDSKFFAGGSYYDLSQPYEVNGKEVSIVLFLSGKEGALDTTPFTRLIGIDRLNGSRMEPVPFVDTGKSYPETHYLINIDKQVGPLRAFAKLGYTIESPYELGSIRPNLKKAGKVVDDME